MNQVLSAYSLKVAIVLFLSFHFGPWNLFFWFYDHSYFLFKVHWARACARSTDRSLLAAAPSWWRQRVQLLRAGIWHKV